MRTQSRQQLRFKSLLAERLSSCGTMERIRSKCCGAVSRASGLGLRSVGKWSLRPVRNRQIPVAQANRRRRSPRKSRILLEATASPEVETVVKQFADFWTHLSKCAPLRCMRREIEIRVAFSPTRLSPERLRSVYELVSPTIAQPVSKTEAVPSPRRAQHLRHLDRTRRSVQK